MIRKIKKSEGRDNRDVRPETERKCFNCGKPGHTDRNCFQPKKVGAMNTGQRNDRTEFRRDCQQSDQSGNYRNEKGVQMQMRQV